MEGDKPEQMHAVVRDLGQRIGPQADARLAPAFLAVVTRIHDLLGDLRPTSDFR